jgi:hypothetical protein
LISMLTLIGSGIAGYIIYVAVESPRPVLYNTTEGSVLVVSR